MTDNNKPFSKDNFVGAILELPVYELSQKEKEQIFLAKTIELTSFHFDHCAPYKRILQSEHFTQHPDIESIASLNELPFLSINLFKQFSLKSVSESEVVKVLYSSGTTSQQKSQVFLDRETAKLQSKVLLKIMQSFIGTKRLPMLIADMPLTKGNTTEDGYTARGAGIQGLAFLGHHHTYLLDEDLRVDTDVLTAFTEAYSNEPVLIFGFTWLLWTKVVQVLEAQGHRCSLPHGIALHSGGWKKMTDIAVDNPSFKRKLAESLGINKVHNFYGMAEQVGSVFVECEQGVLHCPAFAEVIVRNPQTLAPMGVKDKGLLQVLSLLPLSYPGHSLLTEDLGRILGVDDCPCGRKGKYFEVLGRLPKTERRGCSDIV